MSAVRSIRRLLSFVGLRLRFLLSLGASFSERHRENNVFGISDLESRIVLDPTRRRLANEN